MVRARAPSVVFCLVCVCVNEKELSYYVLSCLSVCVVVRKNDHTKYKLVFSSLAALVLFLSVLS